MFGFVFLVVVVCCWVFLRVGVCCFKKNNSVIFIDDMDFTKILYI